MSTPAGARRKRRSRRRTPWQALLWIAPAFLSIAFVFGYGVYRVVEEALHREGEWVGLDNLRIVIDDPPFRTAVGHNLRLLLTLPIIIAIALVLAILLYEALRGWRIHRFAVFLPYILPVPVVGVLFGQILTLHGMLNSSLETIGLGGLAHDWLRRPRHRPLLAGLGDHLEGAGLRRDPVPGTAAQLARRSVRGDQGGRRRLLAQPLARDAADDALDHRLLRRHRRHHALLLGVQLRLRDDPQAARATPPR